MLSASYYLDAVRRRAKRWAGRRVHAVLSRRGWFEFRREPDERRVVWRDEPERVEISRPPVAGISPRDVVEKIGIHELKPVFVETIEDVRLVHGIPFEGPRLRIPVYAVHPESYRDSFVHLGPEVFFGALGFGVGKEIGNAISLVNAWSASYFHWVVEALPRLMILERTEGERPLVVVQDELKRWQRESLQLIGIEDSRIVPAEARMRVRRLLVPSFPRQYVQGKNFSIVSPRWLRAMASRVCTVMKGGCSGNVLVSRKRAAGRRIVNEDEVAEGLQGFGCRPVVLEDLSFAEQANLFREADLVVAPHGAGLANIVFCRPGATVIEIAGRYVNGSFFTLAQALGLRYGLYLGKERRRIPASRSDVVVEVPDLVNFVASCTRDFGRC